MACLSMFVLLAKDALDKQDACCLFLVAVATLQKPLQTVTLCHVWPCLLPNIAAELIPS